MPRYPESSGRWRSSLAHPSRTASTKLRNSTAPPDGARTSSPLASVEMVEVPGIALRMRHDREHVTRAIDQARAAERRSVRDCAGVDRAVGMRVDEGEMSACDDLAQVLGVAASRPSPWATHAGMSAPCGKRCGNRAARRLDRQLDVTWRQTKCGTGPLCVNAAVGRRTLPVPGTSPASSKICAPLQMPEHQLPVRRALDDEIHHAVVRGDRSGTHAIFVRESAGQARRRRTRSANPRCDQCTSSASPPQSRSKRSVSSSELVPGKTRTAMRALTDRPRAAVATKSIVEVADVERCVPSTTKRAVSHVPIRRADAAASPPRRSPRSSLTSHDEAAGASPNVHARSPTRRQARPARARCERRPRERRQHAAVGDRARTSAALPRHRSARISNDRSRAHPLHSRSTAAGSSSCPSSSASTEPPIGSSRHSLTRQRRSRRV